jgi:hypothetical protein
MPSANDIKHDEAVDASWEATRGAVSGAIKWGIGTALLGGVGYMVSPLYRGLTIQFKVYVASLSSLSLSLTHTHTHTFFRGSGVSHTLLFLLLLLLPFRC